jgi:hypothetical protein
MAHGGGGDDFATPGGGDFATPRDFAVAHDLAGADFATTPDLAVPADLAVPPDLAVPRDFANADFAGADFAVPPDFARPPDFSAPPDMARPPCVLFPQSGCGPGEKCTLGSPSNMCIANGNKVTGQACGAGGSDDCVAGDICSVDDAAATTFMCRAFCFSDADCTQPAAPPGPPNIAHCLITFAGGAKACTVACNPVLAAGASGCPGSLGCIYGGAAGIPELTDCETVGVGGNGANCTSTADCASGYACVGGGATGHCRQVCRDGNDNDCTAGGFTYLCFPPSSTATPMFGFCCDFFSGC